MSNTLVHRCSQCESGREIDCTTCKLAMLNTGKKDRVEVSDDGYSISEELTKQKTDHTILILCLVVLLTFLLVIAFTKWMMG